MAPERLVRTDIRGKVWGTRTKEDVSRIRLDCALIPGSRGVGFFAIDHSKNSVCHLSPPDGYNVVAGGEGGEHVMLKRVPR